MPPAPAYTSPTPDPFAWDPFPMPTFLVTPSPAAQPTSSNWVDPLIASAPAPPMMPVWGIVLMAVSLFLGFVFLSYYGIKSGKVWSAKFKMHKAETKEKLSFSQSVEKIVIGEVSTPIKPPAPAYTGTTPAKQSSLRSAWTKPGSPRKPPVLLESKTSSPSVYLTLPPQSRAERGVDRLHASITHANTLHNQRKADNISHKPYIAPRKSSPPSESNSAPALNGQAKTVPFINRPVHRP
ncbi:hypothetical protein R3P38DRAFT_2869084 [Favolaschia claudopus]|uniref:Uncharacterized protein n=1 Tax=Favolaschia claudopus TaxID=2862362 RepID=A0AAW0DA22_9AGAR